MALKFVEGRHVVAQFSTAGALRFIQRGEKRILQQEWTTEKVLHDTSRLISKEWRDVPLVEEEGV